MPQIYTPKFVDMVRVTTTTQGTGPLVCGPAVQGFSSFAETVSVGDSFYYSVQGVDKPAEREVGRGVLQANGSISRQPIKGGLTNFSSGTKIIALTTASEWFSAVQDAMASASRQGTVASRTALAAVAPEADTCRFLAEGSREGEFVFNASNMSAAVAADVAQGIFVAPASAPSGASGAWVRRFSGAVNPEWFGMVPNSAAAAAGNVAAWNNMKAALRSIAVERESNRPGFARVEFPAAQYHFNDTLELDKGTMSLSGSAFETGTILRWTASCTGLRVQYYDTAGAGGGSGTSHELSTHSIIERLSLHGPFYNSAGGVGAVEAEHHGIQLRATAHIRDVTINGFAGDGVYVNAGANDPSFRGNANLFTLNNVHARYCRNGLTTIGADSGAYNIYGGSFDNNRRWGHFEPENATLGGLVYGTHFDSNGDVAQAPWTVVKHGGRWYSCVHGQEAWSAANAPTGLDSDNQGWLWLRNAGVSSAPAWSSGLNIRSGGSVLANSINAQTVYHYCYAEPGTGIAQICSPNIAHGGGIGSYGRDASSLTGLRLNYVQGFYRINRPTVVDNGLRALTSLSVGPFDSGEADGPGSLFIHGKNSDYANLGWYRDGTMRAKAQIFADELLFDTANSARGFHFRPGGSTSLSVDSGGLNLALAKEVRVAGTKVLAARRTGWTVPSGTASRGSFSTSSATTQQVAEALKALIEDLTAHGLIGA